MHRLGVGLVYSRFFIRPPTSAAEVGLGSREREIDAARRLVSDPRGATLPRGSKRKRDCVIVELLIGRWRITTEEHIYSVFFLILRVAIAFQTNSSKYENDGTIAIFSLDQE